MIEEVIPRAAQRFSLVYRVHPRLTFGIEHNPKANDTGPLVNWLAVTETATRPALIFGTSSDRIGTPDKRSIYGTLSKQLGTLGPVGVAPNVGASYSGFDRRLRAIGGLALTFPQGFVGRALYDGVRTHLMVEWGYDRHTLGLLWIGGRSWGGSYSVEF